MAKTASAACGRLTDVLAQPLSCQLMKPVFSARAHSGRPLFEARMEAAFESYSMASRSTLHRPVTCDNIA